MRTFLTGDKNGYRFWNIVVKGKSHTVSFGKTHTAGQTKKKDFATPAAAKAAAEKLVAERLADGYTETTPKKLTPEETAFEDTLRANPDDFAAWCAYADYLAEKGDPRGEFMQVQIALEDESRPKKERDALKKREKALRQAHAREWLGPFAEFVLDPGFSEVEYTFSRGWLDRVDFGILTVARARALAGASAARLLRELTVGATELEALVTQKQSYVESYYVPGPDVPKRASMSTDAGLHALLKCPHLAGVRVFQLGTIGAFKESDLSEQIEDFGNSGVSGELAHEFVKRMPNVRELYLESPGVDAAKLFALPLPKLRVLKLYHNNRYSLGTLAANESLTNLTALLCHPRSVEYDDPGAYITLADLRAVCRSMHLPALTNLRLRLTDFGDRGAEEIVSSGILKRLKVLDLHGGAITDEGAKVLAGSPDLKNLEFLNLQANALKKAGRDLIKATGVRADLSRQHNQEIDDFLGLPGYLFEGDNE